jgi:hypothetical protein
MSNGIRTAFGLTDELAGNIHFAGGFDSSTALDEENFADPLPGIVAASGTGSDSRFEIRAGVNDNLPFDEGSGTLTATITAGVYTITTLLTEVASQLNGHVSAAHTYTVALNVNNAIRIDDLTGTVDLQFSTDAASQGLGDLLGFGTANTGSGSAHIGDTRYSGEVFVVFDLGKQVRIHAFTLLRSLGSGSDWGTVKMYGHASDLGDLASGWDGTATFDETFSTRSTDYTGNELELIFQDYTAGSSLRYWAFLWRWEGSEAERHYVHLLKGQRVTVDSTNNRAFTAETVRGLQHSASRIEPGNHYPGAGLARHGRKYSAKRWPKASVTEVWEPLARWPKNVPVLVVEDYDTMVTASAGDISTATDRGEIFWGALSVSDAKNVGGNAVYSSFDVDAVQVR